MCNPQRLISLNVSAMKYAFILLLVIIFPVIAASEDQSTNTYINKEYWFSISYPSECIRIEEISDYKEYHRKYCHPDTSWSFEDRLFELSISAFSEHLFFIIIIDNAKGYTLVEAATLIMSKISELYKDDNSYEMHYDSLLIDGATALEVKATHISSVHPTGKTVLLSRFMLCSRKDLIYFFGISTRFRDMFFQSFEWLR